MTMVSIETKIDYSRWCCRAPPAAAFACKRHCGQCAARRPVHRSEHCNVTARSRGLRGQQHLDTAESEPYLHECCTYTVTLNASNDYGFSIETKIDYITVLYIRRQRRSLQRHCGQCAARRPVHHQHRQRDCSSWTSGTALTCRVRTIYTVPAPTRSP